MTNGTDPDGTDPFSCADMLAAVATFASGGYDALQHLPSNAAKRLLEQLKHPNN